MHGDDNGGVNLCGQFLFDYGVSFHFSIVVILFQQTLFIFIKAMQVAESAD